MAKTCEICRDARVIRLAVHRPMSMQQVSEIEAPIRQESGYQIFPCPECSVSVPDDRVQIMEMWARATDEYSERLEEAGVIKNSIARQIANLLIDDGAVHFEKVSLVGKQKEYRGVVGVVAMNTAKKFRSSMQAKVDQAYHERNNLVAALARLFPSGTRRTAIAGWDKEWQGCVYIDLPTGQVSYHYHDKEAHLFADLPPYEREWDGHNKADVHDRLGRLKSSTEGE